MRFIHCADLHLDSKLSRYLSEEKARERNGELLQTFGRMVQFAKKYEVRAILIAGDLFDTGKVSLTTKQVILSEINGNAQIDFYYLKGNHDKNTFLMDTENIPLNLKLFDTQWTSYVANRDGIGNIVITGVEFDGENSKDIYGSLNLDPEQFHIVMLHGQDVQYKGKDDGELISLPKLTNKGIDYLALGHIHAYKEGRLDYRGIYCYPGCLEGRGFDECGEHGFVLLEIDENSLHCTRRFVPFAKRGLFEINADVSGCSHTAEMIEKIEQILSEENYKKESLLKIILKGEISLESEKNLSYIQQYFQERYYLVRVEDETSLSIDVRDFQFDESLKGEFVRAVLEDANLSENEKSAIIRYGMQALAGEME